MKYILLLTGIVLLWGCDALQPDKTSLQATSTSAVARPECNSCHGNPPHTGAHRFHVEGKMVSCWDCHSASVRRMSSTMTVGSRSEAVPGHANGVVDVVFPDSASWPTNDNPDFGDSTQWSLHHVAGTRAAWDPVRFSCSAVGCHNAPMDGKYVWRDVAVPE